MKTFLRSILIALICLSQAACNHVFREYDKKSFPTYSWKDGQKVEFTPRIDDVTKVYTIRLGMRYHYALDLQGFRVKVRTIAPSGKDFEQTVNFQIRDEKNVHIGDCAGDICDREVIVIESHKFDEPGEYILEVAHAESGYRVPGILEVGVIIDETD